MATNMRNKNKKQIVKYKCMWSYQGQTMLNCNEHCLGI